MKPVSESCWVDKQIYENCDMQQVLIYCFTHISVSKREFHFFMRIYQYFMADGLLSSFNIHVNISP